MGIFVAGDVAALGGCSPSGHDALDSILSATKWDVAVHICNLSTPVGSRFKSSGGSVGLSQDFVTEARPWSSSHLRQQASALEPGAAPQQL